MAGSSTTGAGAMAAGGSGEASAIGGAGTGSGSAATGSGGAETAAGSGSRAAAGAATASAGGFADLTRRGGGSAGAAGLGGSAPFPPGFFPLAAAGVSANDAFDGTLSPRVRAIRATNSRATTSSMVLEALLTSIP